MCLRGLKTAGSLAGHTPVLLDQVLSALSPCHDAIYVDGTFGAGGYSQAILDAAPCVVAAIDRDPDVVPRMETLHKAYPLRFKYRTGCFSNMKQLLHEMGIEEVDGIVLDIGVSSMQLDMPQRGFSFQEAGPLDMRMSQSGRSAADVVNSLPEKELARIFWELGEERHSRRIAKAVVEHRRTQPFVTTQDLAELIRKVMPFPKKGSGVHQKKEKIDPATRVFQALRIYINDELRELEEGLAEAATLLKPGGKLLVVTFHSLEDRIVKQFFQNACAKKKGASRYHPPVAERMPTVVFTIPHKKPLTASIKEIKNNPRARSAKLRWGIKEISQKEMEQINDSPTRP